MIATTSPERSSPVNLFTISSTSGNCKGRFVLSRNVVDQLLDVEHATHLRGALGVVHARNNHIISRRKCVDVSFLKGCMAGSSRAWLEDRDETPVFVLQS